MKSILIKLITRKILLEFFLQNEKVYFINKMSSESEQTAADLADLTLGDFKTWATVNLKAFLHHRSKNSEGGQESFAAKAFSA